MKLHDAPFHPPQELWRQTGAAVWGVRYTCSARNAGTLEEVVRGYGLTVKHPIHEGVCDEGVSDADDFEPTKSGMDGGHRPGGVQEGQAPPQ